MNQEINPNNSNLKLTFFIVVSIILTAGTAVTGNIFHFFMQMNKATYLLHIWWYSVLFGLVSPVIVFYIGYKKGETEEGYNILKKSFYLLMISLSVIVVTGMINIHAPKEVPSTIKIMR